MFHVEDVLIVKFKIKKFLTALMGEITWYAVPSCVFCAFCCDI